MTDRGRKSDVLGPRYAGTHKVFGPLLTGPLSTAHRYDLQGADAVVGLHYLYDNEVKSYLALKNLYSTKCCSGTEVPTIRVDPSRV